MIDSSSFWRGVVTQHEPVSRNLFFPVQQHHPVFSKIISKILLSEVPIRQKSAPRQRLVIRKRLAKK